MNEPAKHKSPPAAFAWPPEMLNKKAAAYRAGVCTRLFESLVAQGKLPAAVKPPGHTLHLWRRSELDEALAEWRSK